MEVLTNPAPSFRHSTPVTHPPLTVLEVTTDLDATSHSTTALSFPPETIRLSSLDHARSRTACEWPPARVNAVNARVTGGYAWMFVPFTVNTAIVLSPRAVAIWVPRRLNRTAFTWLFVAHR